MKGVAEAPGKVIISGEHFVVHGATALAASIDKVVRVEAERGSGVDILTSTRDKTQLEPLKRLVQSVYKVQGSKPAVGLSITSDLPEGAGLGSSAATMVATAASISALEGWDLDQTHLAAAADAGEKLIHGNPSGIDATTSAVGGVILFKRGHLPQTVDLRAPINLIVAPSGKKRRTGALIQKVSEMKTTYPSLFASLCESATTVSRLCAEALAKGDAPTLGTLMTYNHAVLARAGASNNVLDKLVDLCLASGCLGAKLTGAGGGGSVLAVPPPGADETEAALRALNNSGYPAFLTRLPSLGARSWRE